MNHNDEVSGRQEEPHRTRWRRNLRFVEPVYFFEAFSSALLSTVETNLIEIQYCKAVLNINDETACLDTMAPHFTEVQKYTSTFLMYKTMCAAIFPVISSMFFGPWSDTFGRRPLFLWSIFGYFLLHFQFAWSSATNINPSYFLLFYIPVALTGDGLVLKLASYCYICDITSINTRAFRMGLLFGSSATGALIGTLIVPYLQNLGFSFTIGISAVTCMLNYLYVRIFLEESVSTVETQRKVVSKNPFQWSQVRKLFEACFVTHRTPHVFQSLILATLLMIFAQIQSSGESVTIYLFLQEEYGWTLIEYSWLQSLSQIVAVLVAVIGPSKILGLSDFQLLSLVTGIRLLSTLTLFLGRAKWLAYTAGALSEVSSMNGIIVRSFLSKVIHIDDLGKIFVFCGILESVTVLIGSPIYSLIYKQTLDTNPRAVLLVSIVMCLLTTLILILLRINIKKEEVPLLSHGTEEGDTDTNNAQDDNPAKNETGSKIETTEKETPAVGTDLPSEKVKTVATEIANIFEETKKENEL